MLVHGTCSTCFAWQAMVHLRAHVNQAAGTYVRHSSWAECAAGTELVGEEGSWTAASPGESAGFEGGRTGARADESAGIHSAHNKIDESIQWQMSVLRILQACCSRSAAPVRQSPARAYPARQVRPCSRTLAVFGPLLVYPAFRPSLGQSGRACSSASKITASGKNLASPTAFQEGCGD
ncbi:hypothetical protein BC628DRAFT_645801 [Trametes gibbosa]|nr:hypothetical protein BC628DRAFT_645801 [Trametes gibbosa]